MLCATLYPLTETSLHGLKSTCISMQTPKRVRYMLDQPDLLETTTVKDLEGFMLPTFHGEDELKEASSSRLWNLMFIAAVVSMDKPNRNRVIRRYTSTIQLLTSYIQNGDS